MNKKQKENELSIFACFLNLMSDIENVCKFPENKLTKKLFFLAGKQKNVSVNTKEKEKQ